MKDADSRYIYDIGTNIRIETFNNTTSFKYYPSEINSASNYAEKWSKYKNLGIKMFFTYIFTTATPSDWWSNHLLKKSFDMNFYEPFTYSWSKEKGFGIIIREFGLPPIQDKGTGKRFVETMIP